MNDSFPKSKDVFESGKTKMMENKRVMTICTWIGSLCVCMPSSSASL